MEKSITDRAVGTAVLNSTRVDEIEFRKLSFEDKRSYLLSMTPMEKVALISGDLDNKRLTRAMQPQELYWLFKEVGAPDAMELLGMASPRQFLFILDMELWKGWTFSEDNAIEFLG